MTPVLLMNPRSGGGKVEKFQLVEEAKRRGIEPIVLRTGDDLQALARDAAHSATIMGMAGGDGSQALVARIALDTGIPFVCVPAGTRNHLAMDLGLDRDDVVAALDAFLSPDERVIDVGYVNDRMFLNNVSLGIYGEIVASDSYRDAKIETVQKMLPDLLGPNATPFDLRYRDPDGNQHSTAQLILVSNNPYRLDRLDGIGTRPRLDSGELGIVAVDLQKPEQMPALLTAGVRERSRPPKGWCIWPATEFEVDSADEIAAGIDGESVTLQPPLRFKIVPGALRVRLPSPPSRGAR